jgi:undecaprenyl-diphosphatase
MSPGAPHGIKAFTSLVTAFDMAFFRLLTSRSLPKSVTLPLIVLVRIGDGWIWVLMAGYIWWALPFAQLEASLMHCVLSIAVSLAFYLPIKFLMKRPRPYDSGMDVVPLVPPMDKYSFPSGHTMNNMAVALTLSLYLPGLGIPALLIPLFVGVLRVLFGVHYLSDIAGGTLLGIVAFLISKAIFPSVEF